MPRAGPQPRDPRAQSPGSARRCLVTGGAGFIGSHLVDHLLLQGDEVVVIDDLSTGRASNLAGARARGGMLREIVGDLAKALAGMNPSRDEHRFDEIYHLAAAVGVKRVVERPIESIETNVLQTSALLHYAAAHSTPPTTLIASSSEVYGKSSKAPFSEDDDCLYGPTTAPRWSYACSKAIDEHLALAYHASGRVPCVVARFFNTVGPRQVGSYGMVLPNFVRAALAREDLIVHGDGRQTRCFCDVRDLVPVLPRLLRDKACHGRVFNIGSDRSLSIIALAELVASTLGSVSRPKLVPYEKAFAEGIGVFEDLRQRQPDLRRLRDAVGFEFKIALEQTIRDVAEELASGDCASRRAASAEVG